MAIKLNIPVLDEEKGGYKKIEVDAEILKETIGGKYHFIHRNPSSGEDWIVSEYESGAKAGWGWSVQGAITRAESNINKVGPEAYSNIVEKAIATYGKGKVNESPSPSPSDKSYNAIERELEALNPIEVEEDEDDY